MITLKEIEAGIEARKGCWCMPAVEKYLFDARKKRMEDDLPEGVYVAKEFQLPSYKTKYKTGVDMAEGETQGMLRAHIFGTGYADLPENKDAQGCTVANFRKMMDQCTFEPKPGELIRLLQFNGGLM